MTSCLPGEERIEEGRGEERGCAAELLSPARFLYFNIVFKLKTFQEFFFF